MLEFKNLGESFLYYLRTSLSNAAAA